VERPTFAAAASSVIVTRRSPTRALAAARIRWRLASASERIRLPELLISATSSLASAGLAIDHLYHFGALVSRAPLWAGVAGQHLSQIEMIDRVRTGQAGVVSANVPKLRRSDPNRGGVHGG